MTNLFLILFLSGILILASLVLSSNVIYSREKATPFECGFEPKESGRLPFSMRFFLLAIIFLIFDIEVALLFPLILGLKINMTYSTSVAAYIFFMILLLGLIHEWRLGSLSWVK